jgi:hypothetical protein
LPKDFQGFCLALIVDYTMKPWGGFHYTGHAGYRENIAKRRPMAAFSIF